MPDLLIELFSEEIPARMQANAARELKRLVTDGLVEAGLTYAGAGAFSTPRRLTLSVEGLSTESPDTVEERKGPKVGAPDKAIEGFCRGAGVDRDALEVRDTGKGEVYFASIQHKGRPAAEIVAEVLEKTVRNFPWPKSMRWGAGALRWVRPLHSIICLLSDESGAEVVALDIDATTAGDVTRGHRFMAPDDIRVTSFEDYEAKLKAAKVLLRADERADKIWHDATNMAFSAGLEVVEDQGLLAEVAGLVEWPVVLMGEIDEAFLELPPEVLQTSMKEHQKFFSLKNRDGKIVRFITVANVETSDNGATILAGNQKVLFARLSDAKFFWENDLRIAKAGMEPWLESLKNVTFHNKLGSQADRIDRIAALAAELAPAVGADPAEATEAARFAKADLSSEMVYEFPELQGIMGRYYVKAAGKSDAVAAAAQEHYSPLGPSDDVPTAPVSVAVALADKIDTLTGFWAIDEKPTGSKDPFALRRAALGVIRLVLENGLRVRLEPILEWRLSWFMDPAKIFSPVGSDEIPEILRGISSGKPWIDQRLSTIADAMEKEKDDHIKENAGYLRSFAVKSSNLLSFIHDRLKVYLRDKGIRHDVIDACIAMEGSDDLNLLVQRAEALQAFLGTEDGENLIQGFKRANNILTQAEEKDGVEYSYGADPKFAETDEEKALFAALNIAEPEIASAIDEGAFADAMKAMAGLRAPVDAFFEAVQVNADNDVLRRNRLNLLSRIRATCLKVADLGRIEG